MALNGAVKLACGFKYTVIISLIIFTALTIISILHEFLNVMLNHFFYRYVEIFSHTGGVCVRVCHFIHSPESRWLARSMEGGGGRVSRGSCLIDVFWG